MVYHTTSTSRHWSQTTTTFWLINVSGRSTYSSVHCRWLSVSCCSRSSVEQSSIARHCCPLSLSIFCCRLKSHLFSLSYPAFCVFSHLYSDSFGHYNRFYILHLTVLPNEQSRLHKRWERTLNMKSCTSVAVLLTMSWWTAVCSW